MNKTKIKLQPWFLAFYLFCFVLTACSSNQKNTDENKTDLKTNLNFKDLESLSESALEVPPGLAEPKTSALFNNDQQIINRASRILSGQNESEILIKDSDKVSLERLGPYRWLQVKAPANEVFVYARKFLNNLGFDFAIDDISIGLLETEWKENRPNIPAESLGMIRSALARGIGQIFSEDKIDRFRIRVEPLNKNTTEVFITHQSMVQEDVAGTNTWIFADSEPELEAELNYRFLVYLGLTMEDASNIAKAQTQLDGNPNKNSNFSENANGLTYQIYESFNRAWLLVGWAIDRSDFVIYDRNRQEGVFYIRMGQNLAQAREGFLDQLMFWKDQHDLESLKVQVKLTVMNNESGVEINILSENGERLPNSQAEIFLNDIMNNL